MSSDQADRPEDAGESTDDRDERLDRWVRDHPVWTFWIAAIAATGMFLAVYTVVGTPLIKVGFPLNEAVTSYVGALATTVVALAGALVSVMLARLALKLGYKAKGAADRANQLQEQMHELARSQGEQAEIAATKAHQLQKQMHELAQSQGEQAEKAAARANQLQEQMHELAKVQGGEAEHAAKQANKIQGQMRKFADPRLAETRDGHKAAASLDLLGTLLRVYSAATFSSDNASPPPIEAIRNTYKRANDLISDPGLYRYCAQLVGTAKTADRFASVQSLIYESTMALGRDGEAGRAHKSRTARNAERVAVEIAALSRMVARTKRVVLSDKDHKLYELALDLDWESTVADMSGCDATARSDLLKDWGGEGVGTVAFEPEAGGAFEEATGVAPVPAGSLLEQGRKSVIHVLETDLQDLTDRFRQMADAAKVKIQIHENLRGYASACNEGANAGCVDLIVARWDSSLDDDPRTVADALREHPEDRALERVVDLGMQSVWDKAVFIAKNPVAGRTIEAAMKDLGFLRDLRQIDVSEALSELEGIDLEDEGNQELIAEERRLARLSGKRLWYIHAAIGDLRKIHAKKGYVTVPDFDPYEQMGHGDNAIVVIRPYFARIDMSMRHSEWEMQNQWFEDRVGGYSNYLWGGRTH